MFVKRSVANSLIKTLFSIITLSVFSTGLALTAVANSNGDADIINIVGSLRMESYRLAYNLADNPNEFAKHLGHYEQALQSPSLQTLLNFYTPKAVREKYLALQLEGQALISQLKSTAPHVASNTKDLSHYAKQADQLVLLLQHYSELKLAIITTISAVGYVAIIFLILFCFRFMHQKIIKPLRKISNSAEQELNFAQLDTVPPNELGMLAQNFSSMAYELASRYHLLEQKAQEKTARLQQANKTLEVLYRCSQALSSNQITPLAFKKILRIVRHSEQLACIRLEMADTHSSWQLNSGKPIDSEPWQTLPFIQEGKQLGQIAWQVRGSSPHPHLMHSVASMLNRGVYFNRMQKQHMQLLLMEERATIARELHDSLAQALTFLRIQLTLLKHTLEECSLQAKEIITDFDKALEEAYRQLRELLSTFRLNIQDTDLPAALHQLLTPLKTLTSANIQLHCRLSSQALGAQQQVHALQIVREAVINAIKHANASKIVVSCTKASNGDNVIYITDDGKGINSPEEPEGHYGLIIMNERAARLGGTLQINRGEQGGTKVTLTFPP